MAFVVHDLKNPVNSMDLHAQLLLRDKELPPRAVESALQIRYEARQLTRMIVNLLDLSRADEGQLFPKPTDVELHTLVVSVLSELEAKGNSRNLVLRSEIDATNVHADEDLLRRMLTNLVDNAIRFAPSNTAVTVTARRDDAYVEIRVADAGRGIPAPMRERVFDPFVQIDGGDALVRRDGCGLGLTFCKLVAETHGGRIWVEDALPGAIFCVRLPHEL